MTIKLDGKPLSDFGIELLSPDVHPAAPQTRDITLEIPGRHGLYHFGSTLGQRNFSFECGIIRELDAATLQQRLRQFVAFLLDAYGKPREIRLTFDYEADKYYAVKFAGDLVPERFFSVGSFTLSFVAYDPMAKFVAFSDEITLNSEVPLSSGITLESTSSFNVSVTDNNTSVFYVYNEGSLIVRPKITITGSATEFAMSSSGGKSFTLTPFTSKTLEIDGENYTVKEDGVSSLSKMNAGSFIQLAPGRNTITVRGIGVNVSISFKFKYQFL